MWSFLSHLLILAQAAPTALPLASPALPPAATPAGPPLITPVQAAGASTHLGGVTLYILLGVYFLICIALVAAILSQTTKSEGLSGTIGGGAPQSVFRGKKGVEEQLQAITNYLAIAFLILSIVIAFAVPRMMGHH